MKTLHLYGRLKEQYGETFELDVVTPAEAVRALCVQLPGFEEEIRSGSWHILRGPLEAQDSLDEEGLLFSLGGDDQVHLLPAVAGANSGALSVVVGAVLVAVGVFTFGATSAWGVALIASGAGMAVGGIIQMTTKMPGTDVAASESADQRPSFLFNGPTNTSSQGLAVPRGYGRVRCGSIVVSAALYSEELAA